MKQILTKRNTHSRKRGHSEHKQNHSEFLYTSRRCWAFSQQKPFTNCAWLQQVFHPVIALLQCLHEHKTSIRRGARGDLDAAVQSAFSWSNEPVADEELNNVFWEKEAATSTRRRWRRVVLWKKAEIIFFKLALGNFDELALFMIGELFFCKKHWVMFSLVY